MLLFFYCSCSGLQMLLREYNCLSSMLETERFKIYKATKFENCTFQTTSQSGEILPRFVFSRQTCEVICCCSSAYSARPMRFGSRGACARSYGKRRLISTQAKRARSSPTPPLSSVLTAHYSDYLTIIPRARMGSELIAHEA